MPEAHRHDDKRQCDATTIVTGQSTVFVNGKLWAVEGDKNSHGEGGLIPTETTVKIEGKPVIVNTPDMASGDLQGHTPIETRTAEGSDNVTAY